MINAKDMFNKIKHIITGGERFVFSSVMLAFFLCSLILYAVFYPGTKKLFLFESLDLQSFDSRSRGKTPVYAEKRFIPRTRTKSSVEYFCDELLLGPFTDRYRPLFAEGTKGRVLFNKRKNTLYIDLNEGALFRNAVSSDTKKACALLEQNIRKNYNSIDNIVITMMGHEIYKYTD